MRDEISVPGLRRGPEFHAGFLAGPVASMMGVAGSGGSHGVRTSMRDSMRDPASSYVIRHYVRPEFACCDVLRFLHCGRYPWLWNDEHVLVLPAVICHHVAIYYTQPCVGSWIF